MHSEQGLHSVLSVLPPRLSREILRIGGARPGFAASCGEIRLRALSYASLVLSGRNLRLSYRVCPEEIVGVLQRLCRGSYYAYAERMAQGSFTVFDRVRVGLAGEGRPTGDGRTALTAVRSLVFRFPSGDSEVGEELFRLYRQGIGRGLLLFSTPGGGKTTALRSLAARVVGCGVRAVVVDERGEIAPLKDGSVGDVLTGYQKGDGVLLAVRSLSPEVLFVDEIGGERDSRSLLSAVGAGVPLVATTHAGSPDELRSRPSLQDLISHRAFSVFAGIFLEGGRRRLAVYPAP